MSIFSRLSDIINSNISSLLDKAEDPAKLIRLVIQEMEETLVEVRSTTAKIIADKKELARRNDKLARQADDWQQKAELALSKAREDLAKAALIEKSSVTEVINLVTDDMHKLDESLEKLTREIEQLQAKLNDARSRQKTILLRHSATQSRRAVNAQLNNGSIDQVINRFEHYERKIDQMESEIEADGLARTSIAAEFAALDARLLLQAALAWLAGAAVIVVGLGWAFRRLAAANRILERRTEDLQRANRELMLAAKTSALGAVTAHLIHEIKNPLAGLEVFMAGQAELGVRDDDGRELVAATELTRRLRTMINDVVGVLRDEQHGAHFELTCAEVGELALERVRASANQAGVRLTADLSAEKSLPGRRANLAGLVLRNLLQNAVEASPPGGVVRVAGGATAEGGAEFWVEDRGAGLAEAVRVRLFQPCASTKPGGSGLGLALSQQIAQQAGGRIELVRSNAEGTCFRLVLGSAD